MSPAAAGFPVHILTAVLSNAPKINPYIPRGHSLTCKYTHTCARVHTHTHTHTHTLKAKAHMVAVLMLQTQKLMGEPVHSTGHKKP